MEPVFFNVKYPIFYLCIFSFASIVTANWCTQFYLQKVGVCGCVNGGERENAIVCGGTSSVQDLADSMKHILEAKDDTKIDTFDLHRCHLDFLPKDLFKGAKIYKITVGDVRLSRFGTPSGSESPLNALSDTLEEIFMYRVGPLHDWEWETVRLERVREVRIEQSTFSVVKKEFSDAFPNLKTLYLKYSNVITVEPQAFAFPNKQFEEISLEGNHLRSISRQMFRREEWTEDDRFDNIYGMFFKDNSIRTISGDFLVGLEKMKGLSLEGNRIQHLSQEFFAPCAKSEWSCALAYFSANGNPLDNSTCEYLVDLAKKYPDEELFPGIRCLKQLGLFNP